MYFLAYTKVGVYTAEEFENAFGQFKSIEKPILVDGVSQQLQKKLDVLQGFMETQASKSIQSANNIYNIGSITNANLG